MGSRRLGSRVGLGGLAGLATCSALLGAASGCSGRTDPLLSLGENEHDGAETGGRSMVAPGAGAGGGAMTPPEMPPAEGGGSGMAPPMMPPGQGSCNARACGPEFERRIELEDDFGDSVGLLIDVCHNERCLTAMFAVSRDRLGPGGGTALEVPDADREGSPILTVSIGPMHPPGIVALDVSWRLWARSDAQDGDEYHVQVTDARGAVRFSEGRVVRYRNVMIDACTSCLVAEPDDAGG